LTLSLFTPFDEIGDRRPTHRHQGERLELWHLSDDGSS
jgi:hypothetical protein